MILRARSSSAQYQKGLIDRAWTSIPISSKSARCASTSLCMLDGPSGLACATSPARPSRPMRSLTRSQAAGTRTCAWMSTTFTRFPPMTTSRGLRLAADCAADCRGSSTKPNEDSVQLQPVNNIPAAVPETLFRNSLRVGMVDSQSLADFDFRLVLPDGPTYTPETARKERPYCL